MKNLKRFFQRPVFHQPPPPERSVYEAIVAAARHPVFYAYWHVADTIDGRFDMISLHAFLVLDRLKGVEEEFRQNLVDELFRDMDRSLREMGVGDISVGKKVRKMAEVFYGRVAAYDRALIAGRDAVNAALARNVFADTPSVDGVARLTDYVVGQQRYLTAQAEAAIAAGSVQFKEPMP